MPPIDCEDQELLDGFLAETTELLEKLDDDLINLCLRVSFLILSLLLLTAPSL